MMIVYRVEKDNVGPYRSGSVNTARLNKKLGKHNNSNSRPGPYLDKVISKPIGAYHKHERSLNLGAYLRASEHIFGFSTIKQLKQWFTGSRAELRRNGYTVGVYRVSYNEIYCGEHQTIFPVTSEKIKTIKIP
jgi:hypothetical protein